MTLETKTHVKLINLVKYFASILLNSLFTRVMHHELLNFVGDTTYTITGLALSVIAPLNASVCIAEFI